MNCVVSNDETLSALTKAIDKHMAPSITPTNHKKKQVERPYGESITSVDAYVKIKKSENARKRKITKEKPTSAKADSKQTKSTRKKRKTSESENAEKSSNNNMNFITNNRTPFTNTSNFNQSSYGFSLSTAHGSNIPLYNFNNYYDPQMIQNYQNPYFNNHQFCYKCNTPMYFNGELIFKCYSCGRLCCNTCIRTSSISMHTSNYQCEYCSLNTAVNICS
ncbi:unnamed protein product [Adineta ricciae]|nr:unnamed protein product [Adineta ricciae]